MGGLVIPGVQVAVVKEVLPRQLAPSGVLGLVGFTERAPADELARASSWSRLREVFGTATAMSIPEARQALDNGVSQLVISPLPDDAGARASVTVPAGDEGEGAAFRLVAKVPGTWANGLKLSVKLRSDARRGDVLELALSWPGGDELERHRDVSLKQEGALERSAVVRLADASENLPEPGEYSFDGGRDATREQYRDALARLENEPDVDMVMVSLQGDADAEVVAQVHGDVIAHCERMAAASCGRIGIGQGARGDSAATLAKLAEGLRSDRFVLVAPRGAAGAVAGMIGQLAYYESPTFKTVAGLNSLRPRLGVDEQKQLLQGGVVPVVRVRDRGVICLRGITTDGDQINVRRVADRAVRTMKMIGELFIGRLNNADGRGALKQKLIEALLQMEREGAIVPSTDGSDPAFKVDVYSSQQDFALGIVRVDMAVRPVRAIDYIYATVLVQV